MRAPLSVASDPKRGAPCFPAPCRPRQCAAAVVHLRLCCQPDRRSGPQTAGRGPRLPLENHPDLQHRAGGAGAGDHAGARAERDYASGEERGTCAGVVWPQQQCLPHAFKFTHAAGCYLATRKTVAALHTWRVEPRALLKRQHLPKGPAAPLTAQCAPPQLPCCSAPTPSPRGPWQAAARVLLCSTTSTSSPTAPWSRWSPRFRALVSAAPALQGCLRSPRATE